ncbi:pesticin receptor [alpha proteobacterium Q-1]|nr:pesticin receptor [alpha proteobacterium Q-1]
MKTYLNTGDHGPIARQKGSSARKALLASVALSALFGGSSAMAQNADNADGPKVFSLEEIVVTAQRRSEGVYSTPMAITALSGENLQMRGIDSLADIDRAVPNLNVTRFGVGNPAHAAIFIRGIGLQDHIITTDPGVGVYVDGVYLGRQMGANLDLVNIERIEVLRGPQGTLYGRNTLGGAVNIITQKPGDEDHFEFGLQGGTRARVAANFYGNFKLTEDISMSASGNITRRDGFGKALNVVEPTRQVGELFQASGRVALDWQVNDRFSLLWTADMVEGENGQSPMTAEIIPGLDQPGVFAETGLGFFTDPTGPAVDLAGGPLKASDIAADPDDTNSAEGNLLNQSNSGFGTSLTADYIINDMFSTKVLASFRHSSYTGGLDDDAAFQDFQSFPESGEADQVSIEAQLNGEIGRFDFVSALYYFREEGDTFSGPNTFITPGDTFDINQTTNSYAAFAHVGYRVTDRLKLSGGLRYSYDKKSADALFTNNPWFLAPPVGSGNGTPGSAQRVFRSEDWNEITWNASLTYDLTENLNVYFAESKGYQSGGFPPRPFGGPNTFVNFDPTTARNHELGFKGQPFDFMQSSVAFFFTEYTDLALPFSSPSAAGFVTITANAGKSEALGFELENTFQFGGFSLNTSVGYLDSEIKRIDPGTQGVAVGDTPALTPDWTVNVGPQYQFVLPNGDMITMRADYSYRSTMFGQSVNNELNKLDARDLLNFSIRYENLANNWSATLYGDNVWNEKYDVGRLDQAFSGFTEVILNNDRSEFGLKFNKRF